MNKLETLRDINKTLGKKIIDLETYVFIEKINIADDDDEEENIISNKNNITNYLYKRI